MFDNIQMASITFASFLLSGAALALTVYVWRRRATFGSTALAALCLFAAVWCLGYGLEVGSLTLSAKLFWAEVQFMCAALSPALWLIGMVVCAYRSEWISRRQLFGWMVLSLVVPIIISIFAFTNELHRLIWIQVALPRIVIAPLRTEPGVGFWLYVLYAFAMLMLATLWASLAVMRMPIFRRRAVLVVMGGVVLPWVGGALYLLGLDLAAPLSYLLGGFMAGLGLYRIRLLNLVPIARDTVVENMPDGVLMLDATQRIIDCNPAAQQLLNLSSQEMLGRPIGEVLPANFDLIDQHAEDRPAQGELELHGRACELRVSPLSDRLGRLTGHLVILRDISERKRAAEELDRRTLDLQSVLQSVPDLYFRLDAEGRFLSYTAGLIADVSRPPEDFIGRRMDEVLPEPVGAQAMTALQQALAERATETIDYSLPIDGMPRWFEARMIPTQNRQVICVIRDLTARKQAEAELHEHIQLLENLVTVARTTAEQPEWEATLQNVLSVGVKLTKANQAGLFLLDNLGNVTHTLAVHDNVSWAERRAAVDRLMAEGVAGWVVRQRATALIADTQDDARWLQLPNEMPTRSVLAVPILNEQMLSGILILTHSQPQHFTSQDVHLMEAAAKQMALALRNAQLYETQRRMADRQSTLYEVLRTLGSLHDSAAIAQMAVESIARLAHWPHMALLLPDFDRRCWRVKATSGQPSLPLDYTLPLASEGDPASGLTLDLNIATAHFTESHQLLVPLWHGGRLLGVLNIEAADAAPFDADDLSLAQSLSEAVALALDNARLYQDIALARSRLQATFDSTQNGMVLMGMNARVLIINQPALKALGLAGQPQDWLERSALEMVHDLRRRQPAVARVVIHEMGRIEHGDEPVKEGEYVIDSYVIHWSNQPVLSEGMPIGRLIMLYDVTQERLLETMREDLTNTMVHDLRNPTSVLLGALDLLSASELPEAEAGAVQVAQRAGQRLLNMINAILDVNRLESGQMPLEREPVQFYALVSELLNWQMVLARDKQVQLTAEVPAALPMVTVDAELVRRVLQNLIGNAIKFTPAGGVIRIGAQLDPTNAKWLLVSVRDTGSGVPAEIQPRLFDKFVTGRVRGRGSGLGLAFCRLVVEAHGGRIWVESEPGHGADFKFTLPVMD